MKLLTESELIWSAVVANNRMNRKRKATGVNSYEKDLGFNPEAYLDNLLEQGSEVSWLDLCCGEGNALLQYASKVALNDQQNAVKLTGVDLVDQFQTIPSFVHCLHFETQSLVAWSSDMQYDLITSVHGFHYVGDKLKALLVALKSIKEYGMLIANFDLDSIKIDNAESFRYFKKLFKENNIEYNVRKRLLVCKGPRYLDFRLTYRGADDTTGPNYTGQAAVDAYYSFIR
ncbi:Methyltransferase domain-containing protein [Chitinophaga jiangningensis]|uniref:Methyltransferase domain-containing protein n=1 Tax=Chitinophaga jiangningensis TaxID=1419482 RepID=A0A1M7FJU5_9BACT|nr:class I SAM-dependent methyltransferase [Chitinophaga jiangningensis]SHM04048.1 Methyltransferase domain-containing protein [Chitinophaga jiangningensis]